MYEPEKLIIPPVSIKIDDAEYILLEAIRLETVDGSPQYYVVGFFYWNGIKTCKFPVIVRDEKELKAKLEMELSKVKMTFLAGGRGLTEVSYSCK